MKKNFYWVYFLQAALNSFVGKGRISINLKKKKTRIYSCGHRSQSVANSMTNQNIINKLKQIYNIRLESYVFLVVSRRECQYLDLFFDSER